MVTHIATAACRWSTAHRSATYLHPSRCCRLAVRLHSDRPGRHPGAAQAAALARIPRNSVSVEAIGGCRPANWLVAGDWRFIDVVISSNGWTTRARGE